MRGLLVALAVGVWLLLPRLASAQVTLIDQIPMTPEFGFSGLSDSDCTFGTPNRATARAEDFIVTAAVDIDTIVFWGVYQAMTAPSDPETFRILIHADASGLPGAVITEPTPTISQSLLLQTNISMYQFVATFAPVHLEPGTYWAEIFETDTSTDLCFNWQAGFLDSDNGADGNAVDLDAAPGASWTLQSGLGDQNQLTIRITGELSSVTPTATPSATASPTPSETLSPTPSPTTTASPTSSPTATPSATASPSAPPDTGAMAPAIPTLSGAGGALLGLLLATAALALLVRLRAR